MNKISEFLSLFSAQQKPKKKADNNSYSEPTDSKYATHSGKGDGTYYPNFDVDKESPSDEHKK